MSEAADEIVSAIDDEAAVDDVRLRAVTVPRRDALM